MAEFGKLEALTAQAVADLRVKQYHIMRHAGVRLVDQASQAAAPFAVGPIGVLQNKPNSGQQATVAYFGESKLVAGGVATAGKMLATNGSGRAVNATSNDIIVGRAITTAATDGEVITALLFPPVRLSGAI